MTINGALGTTTYGGERARGHGHDPVFLSGKVKAAQGTLPVGLIVSKDSNGEIVPYEEVAAEVLATGDGATKAFSGTLTETPVEPGSVSIGDGVETFADDGIGRLVGDAGGTGTVYYASGAVSVSFNANVVDATDIEADYATAIDGVLDEPVDTAKNASGIYIPHGSVRQDVLKVGAVAQAVPDTTLLARLTAKGIYAA